MTTTYFDLNKFLTDYNWLENFLLHGEDLKEIERLATNPKVIQQPSKDFLYFNRWRMVWFSLTHPIYRIFSFIVENIISLAGYFHFSKTARAFTVLSRHLHLREVEFAKDQKPLIPARNIHQFSTWDLYSQEDICFSSIVDDRVKALASQRVVYEEGVKFMEKVVNRVLCFLWIIECCNVGKFSDVLSRKFISRITVGSIASLLAKKIFARFIHAEMKRSQKNFEVKQQALFSPRGLCRGGSLWFIFLYLKTSHLFKNSKKHLMSVSQRFTAGMPRQAAVLQFLEGNPLGLRSKLVAQFSTEERRHSWKEKIDALPEGIYQVIVPDHSMVLIKLSEKKQYLWDPNNGLFQQDTEGVIHDMQKYHSGRERSANQIERFVLKCLQYWGASRGFIFSLSSYTIHRITMADTQTN